LTPRAYAAALQSLHRAQVDREGQAVAEPRAPFL